MGVQGLWDLLAHTGRRVSVETLTGKKLAIDASIWMIQFIKAMRDEKGEMVRNAHLIGFFRRICKLLYLRTKPVFVFDGGTPALKRRTVVARRRLRENAQAKIRKTAEKLLLNHLKEMRLKELAKDLKEQRMKQKEDDAKAKKVLMDNAVLEQSKLDETLAASIAPEENGVLDRYEPTIGEEDADEDEELILPAMDGNIDPSVLAALPPSMQLELLMRVSSKQGNVESDQQMEQDDKHMNSTKGKEILSDETDFEENNLSRNDVIAERYNQEELDEMLAASIAAEEDKSLDKNASTSGAAFPSEEGGDEDEEMILPDIPGRVDPAVLAALPPSMQLDLLVQMRERLMAENRQRYQKVKKAPKKFSELQIEAYLKTVAFRREIDQVQKAASGHGVGGVQTSRIASEANREFIFSSSFKGDKQLFISSEVKRNGDMLQNTPIQRPATTSENIMIGKSSVMTGSDLDESGRGFDDDVETYLDERGRIRVSRVRAMGMRMTRDLQRNLDLMKEIEKEKTYLNKSGGSRSALEKNENGSAKCIASESEKGQSTCDNPGGSVNLNDGDGEGLLNNENSIQISFEVDEGSKHADSDDDIFASLVEGKPIEITSADNDISRRQPSDSDADWEEEITEEKVSESFNSLRSKNNSSFEEGQNSDGSEVEWEEGVGCDATNSSCTLKSGKSISKGHLEEESDLQEAIRRSLKDIGSEKLYYPLFEADNSIDKENVCDTVGIPDQDSKITGKNVKQKDFVEQHNSSSLCFELKNLDLINTSEALPPENQSKPSESHGTGESCGFREECSSHNLGRATSSVADPSFPVEINFVVGQSSDSSVKDNASFGSTKLSFDDFHASKSVSDPKLLDERTNFTEVEPIRVNDIHGGSVSKPTWPSIGIDQKLVEENISGISNGGKLTKDKAVIMDEDRQPVFTEACLEEEIVNVGRQPVFTEASLEEEIVNLGQERMNLGDQQRKLERNAESVSSEMFAECQELLQMFGLPYIIAPMEAEAQCAYMELANLVDGVVTDDSDVFLFGARSVYKNIFDDRKYVETYFLKDIEKELGLTREKLIRMALLLGSDYTEGVSGIGIVNAIEVVNAFPEDDGLHNFREWIESPDPTILGNFGGQTRKKGSKVTHESANPSNTTTEGIDLTDKDKQSAEDLQEIRHVFMNKHRNVSKNWHIPPSFPSEAVIAAYVSPQVDKSTEAFSWGKPDIHLLRRLCWEKFGWGIQKSDELLMPVLNEYNKHETQLRLEAFYTFNERFAKIRSKRIKKAVKGIMGNHSVDTTDDTKKEVVRNGKKRRVGSADSDGNRSAKMSKQKVETVPGNESSVLGEGPEQQCQVEREHGSCNSRNGNGKGRARGRGRGRGRGKGRGKESVRFKQSDSSSSDDLNNCEAEIPGEKLEDLRKLRRSARSRKPTQYTVDDMEIDDVDESYEDDRERSGEKITEESLSSGLCMNATAELNHNLPLEAQNPVLEDDNYLESRGGYCADKGETAKPVLGQSSSPFDVDASEDYLRTGGGFCADESETAKPGMNQSSSPFYVDTSEDSLKYGGGFCLDETDKCNEQSAPHKTTAAPAMAVTDASSSPSGFCEEHLGSGVAHPISRVSRLMNERIDGERRMADVGPTVDLVNVTYGGDYSEVGASGTASIRGNAEASSIQGLSPMPLLKRKTRKG